MGHAACIVQTVATSADEAFWRMIDASPTRRNMTVRVRQLMFAQHQRYFHGESDARNVDGHARDRACKNIQQRRIARVFESSGSDVVSHWHVVIQRIFVAPLVPSYARGWR
jgi:hypothetical protein